MTTNAYNILKRLDVYSLSQLIELLSNAYPHDKISKEVVQQLVIERNLQASIRLYNMIGTTVSPDEALQTIAPLPGPFGYPLYSLQTTPLDGIFYLHPEDLGCSFSCPKHSARLWIISAVDTSKISFTPGDDFDIYRALTQERYLHNAELPAIENWIFFRKDVELFLQGETPPQQNSYQSKNNEDISSQEIIQDLPKSNRLWQRHGLFLRIIWSHIVALDISVQDMSRPIKTGEQIYCAAELDGFKREELPSKDTMGRIFKNIELFLSDEKNEARYDPIRKSTYLKMISVSLKRLKITKTDIKKSSIGVEQAINEDLRSHNLLPIKDIDIHIIFNELSATFPLKSHKT